MITEREGSRHQPLVTSTRRYMVCITTYRLHNVYNIVVYVVLQSLYYTNVRGMGSRAARSILPTRVVYYCTSAACFYHPRVWEGVYRR
jgi:hypothetical protein